MGLVYLLVCAAGMIGSGFTVAESKVVALMYILGAYFVAPGLCLTVTSPM